MTLFSRRRFLIGSALGASGVALTGCDGWGLDSEPGAVIRSAESLTMKVQRLLQGRDALAREYSEADISPIFRVNGTSRPDSEEYAKLVDSGFAEWRLKIDGLVPGVVGTCGHGLPGDRYAHAGNERSRTTA
jgi:hypothetical protein